MNKPATSTPPPYSTDTDTSTPTTPRRASEPPRAPVTMRALVQTTYGPPETLQATTAAVPVPATGQVRVRVQASSVNARDWHIMRGEPRLARLLDHTVFNRHSPRIPIRGTDFVGTIESVGEGVTRWRPGDHVFGEADAAWAEYALAAQDAIAKVPPSMTLEHAAALPLAGTTALMCLTPAPTHPGARILINGASGGVGTFALQIARAKGLQVTAVCSARNADQARTLGAAQVIDYGAEDFCDTADRYDVVLDLVGNRSVRSLRKLVRTTGTLVLSGGGAPGTGRYIGPLGLLLRAQLLARTPGPRIVMPQARATTDRLNELAELHQSGAILPLIDQAFDLDHGADAVRYVETEHARGKVLIAIQQRPTNATDGPAS